MIFFRSRAAYPPPPGASLIDEKCEETQGFIRYFSIPSVLFRVLAGRPGPVANGKNLSNGKKLGRGSMDFDDEGPKKGHFEPASEIN